MPEDLRQLLERLKAGEGPTALITADSTDFGCGAAHGYWTARECASAGWSRLIGACSRKGNGRIVGGANSNWSADSGSVGVGAFRRQVRCRM